MKNDSWVLERHIESAGVLLGMARGARTCDGAHVALTEEGGTCLVSVGQHLGGANLAANLSVSPSAEKRRGHGHGGTSEGLAVAEGRVQRRAAGLDICDYGMASHLHILVTARDGCRAGICGRRRANTRETGVDGSFRIGDEMMKHLETSREARQDGNMSG